MLFLMLSIRSKLTNIRAVGFTKNRVNPHFEKIKMQIIAKKCSYLTVNTH